MRGCAAQNPSEKKGFQECRHFPTHPAAQGYFEKNNSGCSKVAPMPKNIYESILLKLFMAQKQSSPNSFDDQFELQV